MTPPNTGFDDKSANFLSLEYRAVQQASLSNNCSLAGSYHCTG